MSEELTGQEKLKEQFLNANIWSDNPAGRARPPRFPGLCGKCRKLEAYRTQYGHTFASCMEGHATAFVGRQGYLNPQDPIVECSDYWPLGSPTLREFAEQAHFIGEIKKVVGFSGGKDG